jgi:uncharacterized protein (UPF0548 family)
MELSCITVGRRSTARLDQRLAGVEHATLSYHHVGSTLRHEPVPGLSDRTYERTVDGTVAQAAAALARWTTHDGIGGRIHPAGAPQVIGTTLLVVAPFGPFEMAVPNRIVAVVRQPDRIGFAYGTLASHAEAGEELFLAETAGPGRVRLRLRVHARPASRLARLGTPIVALLTRAAAHRYLAAWADAIEGEDA